MIIYCDTGLSKRTLHWVVNSGDGIKEYGSNISYIEFPRYRCRFGTSVCRPPQGVATRWTHLSPLPQWRCCTKTHWQIQTYRHGYRGNSRDWQVGYCHRQDQDHDYILDGLRMLRKLVWRTQLVSCKPLIPLWAHLPGLQSTGYIFWCPSHIPTSQTDRTPLPLPMIHHNGTQLRPHNSHISRRQSVARCSVQCCSVYSGKRIADWMGRGVCWPGWRTSKPSALQDRQARSR